jgi:hypothetical protein
MGIPSASFKAIRFHNSAPLNAFLKSLPDHVGDDYVTIFGVDVSDGIFRLKTSLVNSDAAYEFLGPDLFASIDALTLYERPPSTSEYIAAAALLLERTCPSRTYSLRSDLSCHRRAEPPAAASASAREWP